MVELDHNLAHDFLQKNNIGAHKIVKVAGDASFRSYYRIFTQEKSYILMFAPPQYEDVEPFILVDEYLLKNNICAPKIFCKDIENGFLLLEDFGDVSLSKMLITSPNRELEFYKKSVDALIDLHQKENCQDLAQYNIAELMREVFLFIDWYLPLKNKTPSQDDIFAFKKAFLNLFDSLSQEVVVLRDYHADNIMITQDSNVALLDFQDALIGSKAYDLVSLIEDARRDIGDDNAQEIYNYFVNSSKVDHKDFYREYEILSLQRNIKILGIFARLYKRDDKKRYLDFLPRVEKYIKVRIESSSSYLQEISNIIKRFNLF